MTKPYLRNLRADADRLLLEVGDWVIAGVDTSAPWPTITQVVPYLGLDFILRPGGQDRAPTVCLNAQIHQLTTTDARNAILRFGSAIAWSGDWRFEATSWMSGSHPILIGRMAGNVAQDFFDVDELAAIADEETATALAFFREGITTRNPFYAFLNLYKVIAFIHRQHDGKVRGEWIAEALPRLTERRAAERLAELTKDGTDAAKYLWNEGRNAIAHSEKDTFVNPDRIGDQMRIGRDLSVIQALARLAIEERFSVHHRLSSNARPSPIAGFIDMLGNEVVAKTLAGTELSSTDVPKPDAVTVIVRLGAEVHALEGLFVWGFQQIEEGITFLIRNLVETLQVAVTVNLRDEELRVEPGDIEFRINHSSRTSVEQALLIQTLIWAYMRNGSVEVWSEETGTLLGKSPPFIPVNAFLRPEWHDARIAKINELLEKATDD